MKQLKQFTKLGQAVTEDWRRQRHDYAAFPEIATRCIEAADLSRTFEVDELTADWGLGVAGSNPVAPTISPEDAKTKLPPLRAMHFARADFRHGNASGIDQGNYSWTMVSAKTR